MGPSGPLLHVLPSLQWTWQNHPQGCPTVRAKMESLIPAPLDTGLRRDLQICWHIPSTTCLFCSLLWHGVPYGGYISPVISHNSLYIPASFHGHEVLLHTTLRVKVHPLHQIGLPNCPQVHPISFGNFSSSLWDCDKLPHHLHLASWTSYILDTMLCSQIKEDTHNFDY